MRSHGTRARTPRAYATSRRGGLTTTASAALVCLGVLLTAGCGGGGSDGYVAVGAAEQPQRNGDSGPAKPERPDDKVRMVPLEPTEGSGTAADRRSGDGATEDGGGHDGPSTGAGAADGSGSAGGGSTDSGSDDGGGTPASGSASPGGDGTGGSGGSASSSGGDGAGGSGEGGGSGGSGGGKGSDGDAGPSGPAALKVGEPKRAKADDRWCEKVTVQFRNSGGSAVKKGKVTFGIHIIGSLGVDWNTRTTTRAVPAPIGAGEKKDKTWKVCVDRWRVPLGMHIETREARVSGWK